MTPDHPQPLSQAVLAGDRLALCQMLEEMLPRLFNICLRMVGRREHALQTTRQTLLAIADHISDCPRQGDIANWMIGIALDQAATFLAQTVIPDAQRFEDQPLYQMALLRLKVGQRALLVLRDIDHLSYHDISQALGLPESTIQGHLFQARAMLRQQIQAIQTASDAPTKSATNLSSPTGGER